MMPSIPHAEERSPVSYFTDFLARPAVQDSLLTEFANHLYLVGVATAVAIVIGLALGITAHRVSYLRSPIVSATSTILTIPSLALFALFIPIVGIGNRGPIIAMTLYALLPIVRNTVSGLYSVDNAVVESAKGMGMSATMRLWKIELPNAWPVMLAGVRVATLLVVGIAAIAVLVGGDGLGVLIYQQGIRRIGSQGSFEFLLTGTIATVLLAVMIDLFYLLIGRLTISRGLRD
jgi:osmoprotectant transport system permease protein